MGEEAHGTRSSRRPARWGRKLRRALVRPSGLLLALTAAFVLGRYSARRTPLKSIDTPAIRDAAELQKSLEQLEVNLTEGEALVMHQSELKRRHERVSALACTAAEEQQHDRVRLAREKAARHRQPRPPPSTGEDGDSESAAAEAPSLQGHALAVSRTPEHH